MFGLSPIHLLILLAIVVVLFGGGGKLSRIMGDFGKGINAFKAGLKNEDEQKREEEARVIDQTRPVGAQTVENVRHDETVRR